MIHNYIQAILEIHETSAAKWHEQEIGNPFEGFLRLVCLQHEQNFRLWHQEDIARSPDVTDAEIANVNSAIDKLNQCRNDLIERLDDFLLEELAASGVRIQNDAAAEHRDARQRHRSPFDSCPASLSHGRANPPDRRRRRTSGQSRPAWRSLREQHRHLTARSANCSPIFSPAANA